MPILDNRRRPATALSLDPSNGQAPTTRAVRNPGPTAAQNAISIARSRPHADHHEPRMDAPERAGGENDLAVHTMIEVVNAAMQVLPIVGLANVQVRIVHITIGGAIQAMRIVVPAQANVDRATAIRAIIVTAAIMAVVLTTTGGIMVAVPMITGGITASAQTLDAAIMAVAPMTIGGIMAVAPTTTDGTMAVVLTTTDGTMAVAPTTTDGTMAVAPTTIGATMAVVPTSRVRDRQADQTIAGALVVDHDPVVDRAALVVDHDPVVDRAALVVDHDPVDRAARKNAEDDHSIHSSATPHLVKALILKNAEVARNVREIRRVHGVAGHQGIGVRADSATPDGEDHLDDLVDAPDRAPIDPVDQVVDRIGVVAHDRAAVLVAADHHDRAVAPIAEGHHDRVVIVHSDRDHADRAKVATAAN